MTMEENNRISLTELEEKVYEFLELQKNPFTLSDVSLHIQATLPTKVENEWLEQELVLILAHEELLTKDGKLFTPKETFFSNAEFMISPTSFEIENGILFFGHRFIPFCNEEVFQTEIFVEDSIENEFEFTTITLPLEQAVPYYNMLGPEEMFNCFIADNLENKNAVNAFKPDSLVTLSVIDMAEFYENCEMVEGDLLKCIVKNWEEGVFVLSYFSKDERTELEKARWIDNYEDALENVLEDFENYLEPIEQLSLAFYFSDNRLLKEPKAGLEEFYNGTSRIHLTMIEGNATFVAGEPVEEDAYNSGENGSDDVMISSGGVKSLNHILEEIQVPLKQSEVEGFMFDEFFRGEGEFDSFFFRAFGDTLSQRFKDEAQEIIFMNNLEELWENKESTYDYASDYLKGPLRTSILELTEERLQYFEDFSLSEFEDDKEFLKKMELLAKGVLQLNQLLEMLNSEQYTITEDEKEELFAAIKDFGEFQRNILDELAILIST
jgi:hypothetical protein